MIRILVLDRLDPKSLELLNEIPEFEISEKAGMTAAELLEELKNADAVIASGSMALSEKILHPGNHLKLIIRSGGRGRVDTRAAQRLGIEIRTVSASGDRGQDPAGLEAIAILKDFFNV